MGGGTLPIDDENVPDAVKDEEHKREEEEAGVGSAGEHGHYPEDISGLFPGAEFGTWYNSQLAPYAYTKPKRWARQYGKFMRGELAKNFDFAQQMGLKEIDTELQGLQHFAPAAAALKRNETAIDNLFNQYQRTSQLRSVMPGASEALDRQQARAEKYATGSLTNDALDRAMNLNTRSAAADQAMAGGFGATSSVAKKTSDLMSAEQRIQMAQMDRQANLQGEALLSSSLQSQAALELAPTEYSNAGEGIRVTPEVSAGRMAAQFFSETNAMASVPATTALATRVQQKQFMTAQEQQNNQFNAQGKSQMSLANAGIANQFSLAKFGYQVAQAGAVAGAFQTDENTNVAEAQQQAALEAYASSLASAQQNNGIASIISGIASIGGAISGIGGLFKSGVGGGGDVISSGGGGIKGTGGDVVGMLRTGSVDPNSDVGQQIQSSFQPSSAAIPRMATFSRDSSVPQDYTRIETGGSIPGGSVSAAPTDSIAANFSSFTAATGIRLDPTGKNQAETSKALLTAGGVLNAAGVSYDLVPGQRPIGMNLAGDNMFSSVNLMRSQNISAGANTATGAAQALAPLGVMSSEDIQAMNQIGNVSSSERMQARLDALAAAQDGKGFVGAAMGGLGLGSPKDNVPAAYASHQLYQAWDRMSPAQKSLSLSSLGVQNFKFKDGTNYDTKVIPSTKWTAYKPVTVGQAVGLLKAGYNTPTLVKSWEAVNDIHAIKAGGAGNIAQVAETARNLGMLGYGPNGAAVPKISAAKLAEGGWKGVPSLGVGAISGKSGSRIPPGYVAVSSSKDGVLAVPQANAQTAAAPASGSLIGTLAGSGGSSLSAKAIYQSWPKAKGTAASVGVIGGSAVLSGIYNMSPEEQAALSISSMFKNVEAV